MTAQTSAGADLRRIVAKTAPFLIVAVAGIAVRTPLAAAYPLVAMLVFLWIVSDTLMLALVARSSGKPEWRAVLGVLASAAVILWLGVPSALRAVFFQTPILAMTMSIIVLAHVALGLSRANRLLREHGSDRKERWMSAASEIIPPALVKLAVAEITVLHMALIRWGGPADVPANARAFGYHKHLTPMCATLLILSAIEVALYHLLIGHWSRTVTIFMFIVSDVGFVYLVGLIKSFRFRPVLLTPHGVHVRAGFLIDELIPFDAIVAVESGFSGDVVRDPATLNAALLAWPNVLLRLDRPLRRLSLRKRGGRFERVAFRLDDPEPFIRLVVWRLGRRAS